MNKACWVLFLLTAVLLSCGKKPLEKHGAVNAEVGSGDHLSLDEESKVEAAPPKAAVVEEAVPRQSELDLSLPESLQGGVQNWKEEQDRYGVKEWFEHAGEGGERRLKIKTKLRMKEGVEFDKDSSFSNYGDAVDGAEMGFEYKTP